MNETTIDAYDKKRLAILHTATKLFAHYGFKKTTLTDIAESAGLGKASLYHYFQSKEALFSAVISYESQGLLNKMRIAVDSAETVEEKIRAIVKARYKYLHEKKNLYSVTHEIFREMRPLVMEERDKFFGAELKMLMDVIEEGVSTGEFAVDNPQLIALVAMSGLHGLDITFWRYGQQENVEEGIELMLGVFLKGLRAQ